MSKITNNAKKILSALLKINERMLYSNRGILFFYVYEAITKYHTEIV